ncbi:TPR repeat protein [Flavobacterium arsenatis]|uniref:TPR repeat protein n=1 Tax=Flavobacterium arsenatis TaxID=1484332 RepID=A0ABU1TTQ9_9FLAO|nr:hypothetical protein [Flavobacterium arsenatis]MDR6969264.1 TPR repeat protein [Flavobacterium arsenatis]
MNKNILYIVLIIVIFFGLNIYYSSKVKNEMSNFKQLQFEMIEKNNLSTANQFKRKVIDKYDKAYYDSLSKVKQSNYENQSLFLYQLVISNKWKDPYLSYEVFYNIIHLDSSNRYKETPNLDFLDPDTKEFALSYLKKAANLGSIDAKYVLGNYYLEGRYVPKNEVLGKKLLKDAEILGNVSD